MTRGKHAAYLPIGALAQWALYGLASGQTEEDILGALGVDPETLGVWLADEPVAARLEALKTYEAALGAFARLIALTPEAVDAFERALAGDNSQVAVRAAREVLDRVGLGRPAPVVRSRSAAASSKTDAPSERVIRVEYGTPDHQAVSAAPWADRDSEASGAVQGGGVREALREDGDGQDPGD